MNKLLVSIFLIIIVGCSNTDIGDLSKNENLQLTEFQNLEAVHKVGIGPPEEPGPKLLLCLVITDRETGRPVPNQNIHLYHTNREGDYEPVVPGDESTARLSGGGITDSLGRVYIETVLPGGYENTGGGGHIHTRVEGATPDTYDMEFLQYSSFMTRRFVNGSDQHFLVDLKQTDDGTLVGFVTMECKY